MGTKLGNGCTSGHGVCGLPRFSIRSYVAVFTFMFFGFGMSTFRHYIPFFNEVDGEGFIKKQFNYDIIVPIFLGVILFGFIGFCIHRFRIMKNFDFFEIFISFFVGAIFSLGLITSGMLQRKKVNNFLTISENWDPSLAVVMGSACLPNFLTFHFILK